MLNLYQSRLRADLHKGQAFLRMQHLRDVRGLSGTDVMMANLMEVKKPEPIRLDMALVKPPPKPVPQLQPVHKTVVEQQRLEKQEFEKEVSKKEIVDNEIVEQQIEMNKVSRQEVVGQI